MPLRITPHFIDLVYNAALKSFWRKQALRKFLRECRISERFLSTWAPDESKREFLDRLFLHLQSGDKGRAVLFDMALFLIDQQSFPDLEHWEDSRDKIEDATSAVRRLRRYMREQEETVRSEREQLATQQRLR